MATVSTRAAVAGWHELVAGDLESEIRFYTELFGWTVTARKSGEADYPTIDVDGRDHGGFSRLAGRLAHWLTYVRVPNVDRVAALVLEHGGHVHAGPETIEGVGRCTVFADPQGALVAASTPEAGSEPHRGVFLWDELLTTDVEGAARFYEAVFGWRRVPSFEGYSAFRSEGVDAAGVTAKPAEVPFASWFSYVHVPNADEATRRARALGADLVAGPHELEAYGRWSVLLDPGGAVFGVLEPPR